jgi:hypothetical protein
VQDGLTVSAYSGDISSSDAYPTMHRRRRKLPPSAAGPPPVERGGGGVEDSSSTSFLGLHSSATATDLLYSYSCSSGRLDTGTEFFDDDYDYDEEEDENGDGEYCYDVTPVNNNDDDQERQQVFDDQVFND